MKMETAKEKRSKAYKEAMERIKSGEFLEALRKEAPIAREFVQYLRKRRSHAKKTNRRDIPIGSIKSPT